MHKFFSPCTPLLFIKFTKILKLLDTLADCVKARLSKEHFVVQFRIKSTENTKKNYIVGLFFF